MCLVIGALSSASAWAHSDAGSSKTTTTTLVRDIGTSLAGALSSRLNQLGGGSSSNGQSAKVVNLTGSESGRAGAVALKDTAIWGNVGYTSLKNDNALSAYDGHAITPLIGIDTRPIDALTIGIAFGFENVDLDTTFNQGTLEWNGYTATPYAVFRFLRNYSIDVSGSYSRLNNDVSRLNNGATGSFDSDRYMATSNLNGNWSIGKWRLGATVGYLYLHQNDESYTENGLGNALVSGNTTEVGQGRAGVQVGYNMGKVEPYLKARVEHEFTSPGRQVVAPGLFVSPDRTGYVLGAGAHFNLTDRITGGLEGTTNQGRDHQDIWGIAGTIRFKF